MKKTSVVRCERGFTLIEIMIVVSIIGILGTLAIPSYLYAVAKTRQAEAKSNLGGIYDLEVAYHGESNTFGSLAEIGFVPDGTTHYTYCVAPSSCVAATTSIDIGADGGEQNNPTGPGTPKPTPVSAPPPLPPNPFNEPPNLNSHYEGQSFEADAYGRISGAPAPNELDTWMIDDARDLVNVVVGY